MIQRIRRGGFPVVAGIVAAAVVGGLFAFFASPFFLSDREGMKIVSTATGQSGEWSPIGRAKILGVLEVALPDGTRAMVEWPSRRPIPASVEVAEKVDGTYVAAEDVRGREPASTFSVFLFWALLSSLALGVGAFVWDEVDRKGRAS